MTAEEAFDRYHQAVFQFAYRLTLEPELAEDITQECFLAFLRDSGRFDSTRGTVKTYLFAIARNLVLKNHCDNRAEEPLAEMPVSGRQADADLASAVAQAVAALPPLQREAVAAGAGAGTIKSRRHELRTSSPILGSAKAWNLYLLHDASYPVGANPHCGTDRLENLLRPPSPPKGAASGPKRRLPNPR